MPLTGAGRHLTLLGLPTLAHAVLASHLRGGGVAEAYVCDDTRAAGDGAGRPGGPVAPASVLLDWTPKGKVKGQADHLIYCVVELCRGWSLVDVNSQRLSHSWR